MTYDGELIVHKLHAQIVHNRVCASRSRAPLHLFFGGMRMSASHREEEKRRFTV